MRCDAQQIKQVFLNLLLNALQAIGDYGVIRLVTEAQGDFVQIRVEDDGCGIPEGQIEQIFDPFFTTRRTGTAAGLGLAHCYQIVRHHGGPPLRETFHRIAERRGTNKARIATARRLMTLVYYGLRDGEIRCLEQRPAA